MLGYIGWSLGIGAVYWVMLPTSFFPTYYKGMVDAVSNAL